jgi:hypothetical protein
MSPVVAIATVIPIIPPVVTVLISPTVFTSVATDFTMNVRLSIPPDKLPPSLAVWWPSPGTVTIQEGQIFHHDHVWKHLVDQRVLEGSWLVVMHLHKRKSDVH